MNEEMAKNGNEEKTEFLEKEKRFIEQLKKVQDYHLLICKYLLRFSIFANFCQLIFALFCMFYFGCGVGDCQNTLICSVHYIKICQTIYLMNTYKINLKENQANHPISSLNTYLVIVLFYCCLY